MQYHNSSCIIWVTKNCPYVLSAQRVSGIDLSVPMASTTNSKVPERKAVILFFMWFLRSYWTSLAWDFLFKLWPRAPVPWAFALRLWWYHELSSNTNSCCPKCTAPSLDLLPTWQTEGASGHCGGQSSASLIPECLLLSGICTRDLRKNCFLILNGSLSLTFRVFYTMWAVSNSLLCLQQAHWPDGNPTLAVPSSSLMPPAQCFSPTWDVFLHE